VSQSYIRAQQWTGREEEEPLRAKEEFRLISLRALRGKLEKDVEGRHMGSMMDEKQLRRIGLILVIGGMMLFLDGIGSLLVPQYHDFWFDLERLARTIGGILLSLLGLYVLRRSGTSSA